MTFCTWFTEALFHCVAREQRNAEAQRVTSNMIRTCDPDILILVGIGAGVRDKIKLCDVVISENIIYYEPAKLLEDGVERRDSIKQPDELVRRNIEDFLKSEYKRKWHNIFDSLQRQLSPNELPNPYFVLEPSCKFKIIATGEKILADGSLNQMNETVNTNIIAGETESWGFLTAARGGHKNWFVVRGISDFGDKESKDGKLKDQFHHSAANAASSITRTILDSEFVWKMIQVSNAEGQKRPRDQNKKPNAKKEITTPWSLGGQPIQLKNLCNTDFWCSLADNNLLRIAFVLPSGKFKGSIKQLPLVSDAMYLQEIAQDIVNLMHNTSCNVDIQTYFDIDLVNWEREEFHIRPELIKDSNLLLTGSGRVNLVTRLIYQDETFMNLRPGPTAPESAQLCGVPPDSYPESVYPDVGLLSVCQSPFNNRRIIMLCCGIQAVGTIGTQLLLHMYIRGGAKHLGNNSKDKNVPAKIVNFRAKTYNLPLWQPNDTIPPMQLLNVDIQPTIRGNGVLE